MGIAKRKTVVQACMQMGITQMGITEQTCYRWRKEYGGNDGENRSLNVRPRRDERQAISITVQVGEP